MAEVSSLKTGWLKRQLKNSEVDPIDLENWFKEHPQLRIASVKEYYAEKSRREQYRIGKDAIGGFASGSFSTRKRAVRRTPRSRAHNSNTRNKFSR
jgi:hypothetical protein